MKFILISILSILNSFNDSIYRNPFNDFHWLLFANPNNYCKWNLSPINFAFSLKWVYLNIIAFPTSLKQSASMVRSNYNKSMVGRPARHLTLFSNQAKPHHTTRYKISSQQKQHQLLKVIKKKNKTKRTFCFAWTSTFTSFTKKTSALQISFVISMLLRKKTC